jgi:hypothetical protein
MSSSSKHNPPYKPLRLSALYEEAPEGIGKRMAMNLGQKILAGMSNTGALVKKKNTKPKDSFGGKIAKAMGLKTATTKRNVRDQKSRYAIYPKSSKFNTGPVMSKPRHRKFFGLDHPQMVGA